MSKVKTILNSNKHWGVLMTVFMKELDEDITYKGYIKDIKPIKDWFENRPVVHVTFSNTDKGPLEEVIGSEGSTYEWFFPLYSYKDDNKKRAETLVENSGGYMQDIKFVEFDLKKELLEWVLDSKNFSSGG